MYQYNITQREWWSIHTKNRYVVDPIESFVNVGEIDEMSAYREQ